MDKRIEFGKVVKRLRSEQGLSRLVFWEKYLKDYMSREYLYYIEAGKRLPTIGIAHTIACALKIPLDQMLDEAFGSNLAQAKRINMVEWDHAGVWNEEIKEWSFDENKTILNVFENETANCHAATVKGQAMVSSDPSQLSFKPGTVIVIAQKSAEDGDYVIAKTEDRGTLFRRLEEDGNRLILSAINPKYENIIVDKSIEIAGVVLGSITTLKSG